MKKRLLFFLICCAFILHAQEDYFVGQTRFMQKINPSYLGFNSLNKVGVLYNTLQLPSSQNMDNKYLFAALSFDERNFSLGVDFNSFQIDKPGFIQTKGNFHYIYKVQLDNKLFFLPALSFGIGNVQYNLSTIVFEDQLNLATGLINSETIDPTASQLQNVNYFDLGGSFLIHNDNFLFGVSLKHLNRPNISHDFNEEQLKPIRVTLNGGYEFNLNPFDRGFLPQDSYLLTYTAFSHFNNSFYSFFSQEAQLGEFSIGLSQKLTYQDTINLNNIGISVCVSVENLDFGVLYNFPVRNPERVFSPSIFELYLTFDFSKFRRNQRGLFKRINTDNYF